jgi:hypothetical protein
LAKEIDLKDVKQKFTFKTIGYEILTI